jgi:spore coat protein U-like protein
MTLERDMNIKMKRTLGLKAVILTGAAILAATCGYTATETTSMSVSATITNECDVSVGTMAFGTVEPSTQSDATADVTINCTAVPVSASVAVGAGANAVGNQRKMASGANRLNYDLYSDSGRTAAITPGSNIVHGAYNATFDATGTIYGRIPAAPAALTGVYSDTVLLTLTYEPA